MSLIAFIAPHASMLEKALAAFQGRHEDIHCEKGLLSEGVKVAAALVAQGTEIIITRGGTASAIRKAGIEVVVVEVPITGFDIIRTVERAKVHGRSIGVVAFPSMIEGIDFLGPLLGVDISLYPIDNESEAEPQVARAIGEGADVVIGGFITGKAAEKYQHSFALIDSGTEGILQAVQEAKRIALARNLEKTKTGLFRAVLDYAYEGIISVDGDHRITFFNPVAERISKIDSNEAIGRKIGQVWPGLDLKQVMSTGKDDIGHILRINDTDVLCNKVAIRVNGATVGVVVTFQDVGQIQQMEARVRRRIFAAGHVANFRFADIQGISPALKQTIEIAKEFALTRSSVLIMGETGTGKEVFAQSIHNFSDRRQGPFVAINCAALPGQILESELFGYVGGAFTGASQKGKPGLFEVAHQGTIFLDEIGEMEYATQGKLLRALQEKKVRRLGSDSVIPVDVRVIAASNKNLWTMVSENKFRSDLFYRLNVLQLKIPPLRERQEDIAILAQYFLKEHAGVRKSQLRLAPSALQALNLYAWPGNVRELQNVIERVVAIHKNEAIDAAAISLMLGDQPQNASAGLLPDEFEEIRKAYTAAKGKTAETAKMLGISRTTLWRKLKRLGLK